MAGVNLVDLHVGTRLRLRRIGMGLTPSQIAKMTDLNEEEIVCFEAGRERPDATRLLRIARAMRVSASYFFTTPLLCSELDRKSEPANRRRHIRVETDIAVVAVVRGSERAVKVTNLSRGGARLSNMTPEDLGKSVTMFFEEERREGTVVWSRDNEGGVRFGELIPRSFVETYAAQ